MVGSPQMIQNAPVIVGPDRILIAKNPDETSRFAKVERPLNDAEDDQEHVENATPRVEPWIDLSHQGSPPLGCAMARQRRGTRSELVRSITAEPP
jgi:hypothetical protein